MNSVLKFVDRAIVVELVGRLWLVDVPWGERESSWLPKKNSASKPQAGSNALLN
jgi:hypothetical protein